jgi:predicted nucleic acid-binding protein
VAIGRASLSKTCRRTPKVGDSGARRILADILIGAHAFGNEFRLLTLDEGLYRASFPTLVLETF